MRAVLFDVDFTLIYPGPTFQAAGYDAFCRRYGIDVDPGRFDEAVASAAAILEAPEEAPYDHEIYVAYTRHIIQEMGGSGDRVDPCAREIYREWAACHHFELYDDVTDALTRLAGSGIRIGLVSNSHRSLAAFESHFALDGLIAASVSSSEHGFMKPNPSIFRAALDLMHVAPEEALMVGDSVTHDVEGARRAGMKAALLHRADCPHPREADLRASGVPVIRTLHELPTLLG